MADAKDPLHQLIEVAVYAPIGLLLLAQKELPNLVASGRTRVSDQITLARFIGKMAVKRGRVELKRRLDAAEAARSNTPLQTIVDASSAEVDSLNVGKFSGADSTIGDLAEEPVQTVTTRTLPEAIIVAVAEAPELNADPVLPIDGYDSLAASQVVVRLTTLTAAELDQVRQHEESHRARRTILGKISQLRAR